MSKESFSQDSDTGLKIMCPMGSSFEFSRLKDMILI